MERIVIEGGHPLKGEIETSGMKNAALPIIFGCLLVDGECVLENIPAIADVEVSFMILEGMGAKVTRLSKTTVAIDCRNAKAGSSSIDLVRKLRASYYLLGAEIGRCGKAHVGLPGGCDFGCRPIDQHIKGFEALGCTVNIAGGNIDAVAEEGLKGCSIFFDLVSVGATINVMLASVFAEGVTEIENAAREPHIVDLANFLNTCGAQISGAGTDTIKIKGVSHLNGSTYAIIPDMIEAGTYMIAAAATKGRLKITGVIPKHLESITAKLCEMGVTVEEGDDYVEVYTDKEPGKVNVKTQPYPGFPTDMQPQMAVLMCLANGTSILNESVFDNRFRYTEELIRMGANIQVVGKTATFIGRPEGLSAARVQAVDLRAGAAMVIAGLATKGQTEIENINLIERGYDNLVGKLQKCGACIYKKNFEEESSSGF